MFAVQMAKKTVKSKKIAVDPKYIGVPNICFSLTDEKDKREKAFAKQRIKHGFDDSETWSLDTAIAQFTLPRLKRFREVTPCVPYGWTQEKWYETLDQMIDAMELVIRDCNGPYLSKEESKRMRKGLKVFAEHFCGLWW